jgi:phospholipid/cholesterol/gamma-HCH transport system substrate-binding protein
MATDTSTETTQKVKTRRTNVGGKPFSKRNPTPIGAIGLALILALLWASFNVSSLPLIGSGTTYTAYFAEAAGLKEGNEVRIAGVKVGKVESVGLSDGKVKVEFTVKSAFIGDESTAAIKIKTLLGAKFVGIESIGTKKLDPDKAIPLERTTSPFDVYPAFTGLTNTINDIDTGQLATAFQVLADDFKDTPDSVRTVVEGLSRLSNTISSRDAKLRDLLSRANQVSGLLSSRNAELQKLLDDGGQLLDELHARRDTIHSLLVSTTELSIQLEGLVDDNQDQIQPLLDQLQQVLDLLNRNQDSLDRGLALLGPYYRVFNNVIGNGRWFDNYVQNLSGVGILGFLGLQGN